MKTFLVNLVCATALMLSSCSGGGSVKTSESGSIKENTSEINSNELWSMLSGIWRFNQATDLETGNVFYFFGYDDDQKPMCFSVWYYEAGEREYVTKVEKLNDSCFRVALEVPANEEEGLFEIHDSYTIIRDYDLSRYSEKIITASSSDSSSEWKYEVRKFDELTYKE